MISGAERCLEFGAMMSPSIFALSGNSISVILIEVFWDLIKRLSIPQVRFSYAMTVRAWSLYQSPSPSSAPHSVTLALDKALSLSVPNL